MPEIPPQPAPGFEPPLGDPSTVQGDVKEPEIPAEAVQAAADALEVEDANWAYFTWSAMAKVAVESAAPFLAEHIARLIEAACPTPMDPHPSPCPHMEDSRIAREAFPADAEPATTAQTAPQSTETDATGVPRVCGWSDDGIFLETPTALRERISDRLLAKDRDSWGYGMFEGSRTHALAVADEMLAVRDDALADALRRAEQAEATVAQVREDLQEALAVWKHEYDFYRERADRKGYSHDEAARAAYYEAIQAVSPILAALDVPADGEQTPTPTPPEEGNRHA